MASLVPLALALTFALMVALVTCVFALQRHLLFPAPKAHATLSSPHHRIRAISMAVNGKVLRGYLACPRADALSPQGLLYFNGRRENPTSIFRALAELPQHHVLCFFYDRLGPSWRKPGERELVADALAVFDWWVAQPAMSKGRISVAGRSLGSGLAVQVAAERPLSSLVLISPHDRLISAVRHRLPWVPAGWLRDPFNSRDHIAQVQCPCLLIVADEDGTIPGRVSRALFSAWQGALTEFLVRNCGHRGVLRRPEVHRALAAFLGRTAPAEGARGGTDRCPSD